MLKHDTNKNDISTYHSLIASLMTKTMMRMFLHFLSVLLGILTILGLIQAQDQSGLGLICI